MLAVYLLMRWPFIHSLCNAGKHKAVLTVEEAAATLRAAAAAEDASLSAGAKAIPGNKSFRAATDAALAGMAAGGSGAEVMAMRAGVLQTGHAQQGAERDWALTK